MLVWPRVEQTDLPCFGIRSAEIGRNKGKWLQLSGICPKWGSLKEVHILGRKSPSSVLNMWSLKCSWWRKCGDVVSSWIVLSSAKDPRYERPRACLRGTYAPAVGPNLGGESALFPSQFYTRVSKTCFLRGKQTPTLSRLCVRIIEFLLARECHDSMHLGSEQAGREAESPSRNSLKALWPRKPRTGVNNLS